MKFLCTCFIAFLFLFLYSFCVVSGKCARLEEQIQMEEKKHNN